MEGYPRLNTSHPLDTAGQDLDEAREQAETTIASLRSALDKQEGDLEPVRQVVGKLERIAAEIAMAGEGSERAGGHVRQVRASLALGASPGGRIRHKYSVSPSSPGAAVEIISLFADCLRCRGQGLVPGPELPDRCPACRGQGFVLTPEGRTILRLWKLAEGNGGEG